MNLKKISITLIAMFSTIQSFSCTTIIVGKGASKDGSILIARNVDGPSDSAAVRFIYHPPKTQGYIYQNFEEPENKFQYKMPNNLLGYSGLPDWQTDNRGYEESGFNDLGVSISATETIFSNTKVLEIDPYVEDGISEEAITTIILPQINSAKQGVELLGSIIEKYGAAEGFGVAFADKDEAWYMENAGGHEWVAVKIPDDKYFVSANQSRIGTINLNDKQNVLSSANLVSFAKDNGLYDSGKFNFRKIYSKDDNSDAGYNYPRVKYLQELFTPSEKNKKYEDNSFPTLLTPKNKISITNIEDALENHFQGTEYDPYELQNPTVTDRPISVYRTQQSHILSLRKGLPLPIANVEYLSLGMSALSIYVPFYQGAKIPLEYQIGNNKADNISAYWKFRKLQMMGMLNFPKYAPIIKERFDLLNKQIQDQQKIFEQAYIDIYKKNPIKAQELLDNFTTSSVNAVFAITEELTNELITMQSSAINDEYKFPGA
ncbi:C69 family dipeptidase [Francisella sciaenopsi]|uniref:Dipeptidase n=1 Tax=Francisella sciaenopsi TaxID=3055034 RepID=A0ABQ6PGV1_9GAMM